MGYGVKLLTIQTSTLSSILAGKEIDPKILNGVKSEVESIDKVHKKLCRLNGFTIDFIINCDTLFNILKTDFCLPNDFSSNIYVWKGKYSEMWQEGKRWCNLEIMVALLIDEYGKNSDGYDENCKKQTLECLETLYNVIEMYDIFKIC